MRAGPFGFASLRQHRLYCLAAGVLDEDDAFGTLEDYVTHDDVEGYEGKPERGCWARQLVPLPGLAIVALAHHFEPLPVLFTFPLLPQRRWRLTRALACPLHVSIAAAETMETDSSPCLSSSRFHWCRRDDGD